MSTTHKRVSDLISGAPRGTMSYMGNGWALDETGKPYRVQSQEQYEVQQRWKAHSGKGRSASFFWNRIERMPLVVDALSNAQLGYLLVLASHVDYDGIIIRNENDTTPMTTEDMQKVLRLTKTKQSTFYDFLDACISHGIITKDEYGRFSIAQAIHFRGKTGNDPVVKTYITKLRGMFSEVKASDIGILYRLIPYIHKDSNILCANPEERDAVKVRKLSRNDIATILGVRAEAVSRATGRMVFEGKSVFAKITTATDGTFYMINPKVFRRKDTDFDVTVRGIFGLSE